MKKNIALCFCVRNCQRFLPYIFKNIDNLKSLNFNFYCVFIIDNCIDNSFQLLNLYKNYNKNIIIKNIHNHSKLRTLRIAKARNECLNIVYNQLPDILYHFMIDSDNVNISKWNIDIINNYLNNFDNDDWDCISFNRNNYYDIWALLFDNFRHHCWGFGKDSRKVILALQKIIKKKLDNSKSNSIEVISAFNGFCIYKTERFKDFFYDGLYKNFKNLVTDDERNNTIQELKKVILDVDIDENYENNPVNPQCCEHLFYHLSAFKKGRKIKISKFKVVN
tara:strand:- start:741 stop:1574 length:834 start_codon:yes stop_codon:yes gene_type:complete